MMKYDKEIRDSVKKIMESCVEYTKLVESYNECAYTDRVLEHILESSKTLDVLCEANNDFTNSVYRNNVLHAADVTGHWLNDQDVTNICCQNAQKLPYWSASDYEKAVSSYFSDMVESLQGENICLV